MSEIKESPFDAAVNRAIAANKEPVEQPVVVDKEIKEEETIPVVPEVIEPEVVVPEVVIPEVVPEVIEEKSNEPKLNEDGTPVQEDAPIGDIVEADNFDEWDTEENVEVVTEETKVVTPDYVSFAKDLGLEGATTKEEIVAQVKAIKEEKAHSTELMAGLPENLKRAIEIADLDGDYMQYLGITSVDYNKVDSMTLVQDLYATHLKDDKGVIDTEKLAEALEGLTDLEIEIKGNEIRGQYMNQQEQFKVKVQQEAQAVKLQADKDLKAALGKIESIRDLKLNGAHKKNLYDSISSGKMVQDLFYGSDGKMDYDKVVKVVFDAKYGDKVDKYLKQRITTTTKKEMLKHLGNVNISPTTGELPNVPDKPATAQGELAEYLRGGGTIHGR